MIKTSRYGNRIYATTYKEVEVEVDITEAVQKEAKSSAAMVGPTSAISRFELDRAIIRVRKSADRSEIIRILLATISDDCLTREVKDSLGWAT